MAIFSPEHFSRVPMGDFLAFVSFDPSKITGKKVKKRKNKEDKIKIMEDEIRLTLIIHI